MAGKTFLSRLSRIANSLQGPEEKTSEEMDRELEESVNTIKSAKVDLIDASTLMSGGWGEAGDTVFIMSLPPIYDALGSRKGRIAEALRDSCTRIFSEKIPVDSGFASIGGDNFIMRFSKPKNESFMIAGAIVNAIGIYNLSDRFKVLDIPDLLIVAEVGDITNKDGSISAKKVAATVDGGGRPIEMQQPGDGAPQWFKIFWNENTALAVNFEESQTIDEGPDNDWTAISHDKRQYIERGPARRVQKIKISARKERRTSWHGRRMIDSMQVV